MSSDDFCLFVENIFRLVLTWCDGGVCPSVRERSVVVRHVPDSPATGDPPVFVWRLGHGQDRQTWTRGARTTVPRGTAQPRTAGVRVSPCLSVHLLINSRNKKKPIKNRFLNTNGSVSCRRESSHHDNQHNNHNSIYNQYNSTDNNGNVNDDNRTNNDACALHYYYSITKWYKVGIYWVTSLLYVWSLT